MNDTQRMNTVQGANTQNSHTIRPMIPTNDVIEDFSD